MRSFTIFIATLLIFSKVSGQSIPVRQMNSRLIGKDSVIIYFNEHYRLVEPDCASIIRYGHYDPIKGRFIGKFKDISKIDTSYTVSQGNYSDNGLKNGEFIIYYLNGALQAKGHYKNNVFEGDWIFYDINGHLREKSSFKDGTYSGKYELYNENGSPNIFMKITGDKCEITDAWADDKKIIDNGNGDYTFFDGTLTWGGKLLNGVPDGVWTFQASNVAYGSEVFKKGKFLSGSNKSPVGNNSYDDRSRIKFLPRTPKLALLNSELLMPASSLSCDGTDFSKFRFYHFQIFN